MRRLYYTILFAAAAFAGCQREDLSSPVQENDFKEVYATTEDMAPTKTYMDGTEVLWSAGDQIAAFLKNTLRKRFDVTDETAGSKDATFLIDNDYIVTGSNVEISNNIAYYPFCNLMCTPEGASYRLDNIILPSVQTYAPSSAGNGTYPMVAVTKNTDDVNFGFRNVCGALMLQFQGYGSIKSITLQGNSDEVLCGSASVTAAYGKAPELSLSDDGGKIITLDCGQGVELNYDTPVAFYISLPPTPFADGFTVIVTDTWGGTKEFKTTNQNSIVRSAILRMPAKEYVGIRPVQEGDYVDEYGMNHGQGVMIGNTVWAPVNCGYHPKDFKYGKLYQWGRKYGQGYNGVIFDGDYDQRYSDTTTPITEAGGVSLITANTSSNENVFYCGDYDWMKYHNDNVWNYGTESDPIKTEYDPCPDGWRIPTYTEFNELYQNSSSWTTNSANQEGRWFSGPCVYDPYVPQVFLSASGYIGSIDGKANYRHVYGTYFSSKAADAPNAYGLIFYYDTALSVSNFAKGLGSSVRCVRDDSEFVVVESITLNSNAIELIVGECKALTLEILPSNANHSVAFWNSDDASVAIIDAKGNVTAVAAGTATITAMAGMKTTTCTVTVRQAEARKDYIDEYGLNHGKGVKIGETVWAPVNCGYHATDFKYGKLYQWGRKYGQGYSGSLYDVNGDYISEYSDASVPVIESEPVSLNEGESKENSDKFYAILSAPYDWVSPQNNELWNAGTETEPIKTEYDPCPDGWRVPTYKEINELVQNYSIWSTDSSGQNGLFFFGLDPEGPGVFLPAAGYHAFDSDRVDLRGKRAYYWSSKPYKKLANNLSFYNGSVDQANYFRTRGESVRCVQE